MPMWNTGFYEIRILEVKVISYAKFCFLTQTLTALCIVFIVYILKMPWPYALQLSLRLIDVQSLSSNIAMGYGFSYFAQYEEQAIGAQWSNIGTSPIPDDTFSLEACISMMFLDTIIYFILTWYIEAVFPGGF